MTDRLAELAAKVAARRARSLAAWQARYDATAPTGRACRHCGSDRADRTEIDGDRIGWLCARCATGPEDGSPVSVEDEIAELAASGLSYAAIGREVGVSREWVRRIVKRRKESA